MMAIWLVATNTLKQTVRQRLFLNVAIFGVGMVLLSIVVGHISMGYPQRVVRSIGLSGVTIALDLMALLVAVSLIHADIDKKTLFVVLTRPISRSKYVVGRYVGLLLALGLALVGFAIVYMFALVVVGGEVRGLDVIALLGALPEAAILGGFGLVLSAFSTPTLSAGLGLGFWIAAATTDDLLNLTANTEPMLENLGKAVYYVLPSLERFNFRENAVYGIAVGFDDLSMTLVYAVVYLTILVSLACVITTRREML